MSVVRKWLGLLAIMIALSSLARAETTVARPTGSVVSSQPATTPPLRILSEADRKLYQEIFALQEDGSWKKNTWPKADRLIKKLKNKVLLGHVLAQRYLHPTGYRSKYDELYDWMKRYADHFEAKRIYKLALKRRGKKQNAPRRPSSRLYPVYQPYSTIEQTGYVPVRRNARKVIREVRRMVALDRLTKSTKYISQKDIRKQLSQTDYDLARTIIATGWFFTKYKHPAENAARAFDLAHPAAHGSGDRIPYAQWITGLSAYRLGKYVEASRHLEALSRSSRIGGWDRAAAAFWAARANMKGGRPERVGNLLNVAAREERTFYGLIARQWLGQTSPFDWTPLPLTNARLARIRSVPGGKRVLALLQVKQNVRADRELRTIVGRDGPETTKALMALSHAYSLPASSYRAGAAWSNEADQIRVKALYPVPTWKPHDGYKIDRALIFAFMRQESAFHHRARSHAGAMGLMQLMPATATFIAGRKLHGSNRIKLYDPELNVTLAQKYMLYLLDYGVIKGDLLRMSIAYNGGPGNLEKWLRRADRGGYQDALMFIECIPSRETRIFVERVLASLWIYRDQFAQEAPTLRALASGRLALYESREEPGKSWARNVRD